MDCLLNLILVNKHLLRSLKNNEGILDGTSLYSTIKRPIMLDANQEPNYSDIRFTGHAGGDFLFVKTKKKKK